MKENYIKGMLMIILSAFCFACMNVCVRLSGDLPSVQKSFFRNLVAAAFAAVLIYKNHIRLNIEKTYWPPLLLRCIFWDAGDSLQFLCGGSSACGRCLHSEQAVSVFCNTVFFLILKERITPVQAACVLLAFGGACLL